MEAAKRAGVVAALWAGAVALAAAPQGEVPTADAVLSALAEREQVIRQGVIVTYTATHSLLPGYAEQRRLRTATLKEYYRRGAYDKEPNYLKARSDWETYRRVEKKTVAVRGEALRVDYDVPEMPKANSPAHHHVNYWDGLGWLSFNSINRYGQPSGSIRGRFPLSGRPSRMLIAMGLALPSCRTGQFFVQDTLATYMRAAQETGRLDAEWGALPDDDVPCVVVTGHEVDPAAEQGWSEAVRAWLDPACGYAPLRVEVGTSSVDDTGDVEFTSRVRIEGVKLAEKHPGLWLPLRAVIFHTRTESVADEETPSEEWPRLVLDTSRTDLAVEEIRLGPELPDERFTFEFPPGTRVLNTFTDTTFVTE